MSSKDNVDYRMLVARMVNILEDLTEEEFKEVLDGDITIVLRFAYDQYGESYINSFTEGLLFEAIEMALKEV